MAPRKRRQDSLLRYWREYLAISPFYILFAIFGVFPLGFAVYLSTLSWDGLGDREFVGFDQFVRLVTSGEFLDALGNTVIIFLMAQVPVIVASLGAAALLSSPRLRAKGIYQTLFFLPQVTSIVAVAIVFQSLFSNQFGIINTILEAVGLSPVPWTTTPWGTRLVVSLMVFWRSFGYFVVIFLAGISSIPPSLYEAAHLDGAGPWRVLRSITVPMIWPTVLFVTITGTIGGFQIFTEAQVLTNGDGGAAGSVITLMFLQVGYMGATLPTVSTDLGYATAIGWGIFVVLIALAAINSRILIRRRKEAS
ncbi:carbohydrate ABC transporter permease [Ruania alba]|uniref:Carbohydrate ABC transporter membrane protein 1, CUT1 family n=1 Tax=Ruania alba TaxID=648782 RepID=A0A1H5KYL8_9MICO|nr:sugar ABC transporter permease [Ruania alba]SEE69896.1 carbohydrate ABC transporter membrane protein 1, CUT1 family [Ruania alba]